MGRVYDATAEFNANFQIGKAAPLDNRDVVETYADLGTAIGANKYFGEIVYVLNDTVVNNEITHPKGYYYYKDDTEGWVQFESGGGSQYVLPKATSNALGGIMTGYTPTANSTELPVYVNGDGRAYVMPPAQVVDGFYGKKIKRYAVCTTAASSSTKVVTIADADGTFQLTEGAIIVVKFNNANTTNNPTLRVDTSSTTGTAKSIYCNGVLLSSANGNTSILKGILTFVYDGTQYNIIGGVDIAPTVDGFTGNTIKRFVTCTTEATTATKVVTVDDGFTLTEGAILVVKFSNTNTATSTPKLQVNTSSTTGTAKNIYFNGVSVNATYGGILRGTITFVYDGSYFHIIGGVASVDGVVSTNTYIKHYALCSTSAATAAKTVSITGGTFILNSGSVIHVKFSVTNTAENPTLNVNGTGAKSIYYNGVLLSSANGNTSILKDILTFVYDGTQYNIIGGVDVTPTVDGVLGNVINRYAECTCDSSSASLTASVTNGTFALETGATVVIRFTNNYTYTGSGIPTLNIGGTGTQNIYYNGSQVTTTSTPSAADIFKQNAIITFVCRKEGTNCKYEIVGSVSENYQLPIASSSTLGGIKTGYQPVDVYELPLKVDSNGNAFVDSIKQKVDGVTGDDINRYAICTTAAATAEKTATITGGTFSLVTGASVTVRFEYANTATSVPKLNINDTGAKYIDYNGSLVTATKGSIIRGVLTFVYDGTQYNIIGGVSENYQLPVAGSSTLGGIQTGYTYDSSYPTQYPVTLDRNDNAFATVPNPTVDGFTGNTIKRYVECLTAAATATKVVTIADADGAFTLAAGTILVIKFNNANTATTAPKLQVNTSSTTGTAKTIYCNGTQVSSAYGHVIKGVLTFIYDGTYFHIISGVSTKVDGIVSACGVVKHYATCSTTKSTAAKTASISSGGTFTLETGAIIVVKFNNANTATTAPTLNVGGTGTKNIYYNGSVVTADNGYLLKGIITFVYDGTQYQIIGGISTLLSDALDSTSGVNDGVAATPYAVKKLADMFSLTYGGLTYYCEVSTQNPYDWYNFANDVWVQGDIIRWISDEPTEINTGDTLVIQFGSDVNIYYGTSQLYFVFDIGTEHFGMPLTKTQENKYTEILVDSNLYKKIPSGTIITFVKTGKQTVRVYFGDSASEMEVNLLDVDAIGYNPSQASDIKSGLVKLSDDLDKTYNVNSGYAATPYAIKKLADMFTVTYEGLTYYCEVYAPSPWTWFNCPVQSWSAQGANNEPIQGEIVRWVGDEPSTINTGDTLVIQFGSLLELTDDGSVHGGTNSNGWFAFKWNNEIYAIRATNYYKDNYGDAVGYSSESDYYYIKSGSIITYEKTGVQPVNINGTYYTASLLSVYAVGFAPNQATDTRKGLVKLTDTIDNTHDVDDGVAVTPKAVYDYVQQAIAQALGNN